MCLAILKAMKFIRDLSLAQKLVAFLCDGAMQLHCIFPRSNTFVLEALAKVDMRHLQEVAHI